MNEPAPARRNRWRWGWAFSFLFLAHVGLVFWFNQRNHSTVPVEKTRPFIFLPTDENAAKRITAAIGASDPALYALPSERGFSGKAWLSFTPDDVRLSNWSAPPSWLQMPVNGLGLAIVRAAQTNQVSADALLDDLRAANPFELRIPAELLTAVSGFVVEGPLAQRALLDAPRLPAVTNADIVGRTVVELAVNGDGIVESVVLAGESGLKAADAVGLLAARKLAFAPLRMPRPSREFAVPQRGRVIFTWQVIPAPMTNSLTSVTP